MRLHFLAFSLVFLPVLAVASEVEKQPITPSQAHKLDSDFSDYKKSIKRFVNCLVSGKCENKRQEQLVSEITTITKRIATILALTAGAWYVTKRLEPTFQAAAEDAKQAWREAFDDVEIKFLGKQIMSPRKKAAMEAAARAKAEAEQKAYFAAHPEKKDPEHKKEGLLRGISYYGSETGAKVRRFFFPEPDYD